MKKIRKAYRAGQFYPDRRDSLKTMIKGCFASPPGPVKFEINKNEKNIYGGIAPHAGYVFSGPIAAYLYKAISDIEIDTFIILGPNHTGIGPNISVYYPEGVWQTPLGDINVDGDIAQFLNENGLELDSTAHQYEHSIEVQIPFIQYKFGERPAIVPISYLDQSYDTALEISRLIKKVIDKYPDKRIFILASTDLNHFGGHFGVSAPASKSLNEYITDCDLKIIEKINKLDGKGLVELIEDNNYTMCGYGPVVTAMESARLCGKFDSVKLNYNNSLHYMPSDSAVGYLAQYFS